MARFANDSMRHKLHQIAMDGSQKLPQRWLQGAQCRLEAGAELPCTALGIAAWIHYTSGTSPNGAPHEVSDPMAATFAGLHRQHSSAEALVRAFFGLDAIFPPALVLHQSFVQLVCGMYQRVRDEGVMATLSKLAG